jgi:D-sedoheptulose 7-phosphate isomerase
MTDSGTATSYLRDLGVVMGRTRVTAAGGAQVGIDEGITRLVAMVPPVTGVGKVQFIGNGGSATIASHAALDWWKNGGVRAVAYNDAANLTAISNDFGYDRVFEMQVDRFAQAGDLLVAVSSSGKSPNVIAGVKAARARSCAVATMSGFSPDNPLSRLGDLNFHVPSDSYGMVEVTHSALLHCVMSVLMNARLGTPQTQWR